MKSEYRFSESLNSSHSNFVLHSRVHYNVHVCACSCVCLCVHAHVYVGMRVCTCLCVRVHVAIMRLIYDELKVLPKSY